MTDLELLYEFESIIESIDMPEHLQTALVEALYDTHGGFNPRQLTPEDKQSIANEVERRVNMLGERNRQKGIPFDETQARADFQDDARRHPRAYLDPKQIAAYNRGIEDLTKNQRRDMNNAGIDVLTPEQARFNYYKAAIDVVSRVYKHFQIPFDKQRQLEYVQSRDADADHMEFDRSSADGIYFRTFIDANANNELNQLKKENPALKSILQGCYWFLINLQKAREDGSEQAYLMFQRERYEKFTPPEVKRPESKLSSSDQAAFDRNEAREAERLAVEQARKGKHTAATQVNCIGDLRDRFKTSSYFSLFKKFSQVATPEQMAITPNPNEQYHAFLWRVERGNLPIGTFAHRLAKNMRVAYEDQNFDRILNYYLTDVKQFKELAPSTKMRVDELVNSGEVDKEDADILWMWYTFHQIKDLSIKFNRKL